MKDDKWQDRIGYIMDEFDFHKVHRVMEFLNWEWRLSGVPSVGDLRKTARRLLQDVCSRPKPNISSTGGFRAERDKDGLSLVFELESMDADE